VTVGGVTYREFLLGINQDHAQPLLSLDELRLYVGNSPTLSGYNPTTVQLAGLNPVYDLGAGGDNWVKLDASLTHGNGSGDMLALIPDSLFGAPGPDTFVYLYSKLGVNIGANGGFEQWAVTSTAIPVANLSSLSGSVINTATTTGLGGVTVTLTGVDVFGQAVTITTTTAANGSFSFGNPLTGTYTITQSVPTGFNDVSNTVGSLGGTTSANLFNVTLGAGSNGNNYIFGDIFAGS
jgi:hypothetical protein